MEIYEEIRPWGVFRRFIENCPATVKIIEIRPGQAISLQSHEKRSEFWRIIEGSGKIEIGGQNHLAQTGDEFFISVGQTHRAIASDLGLKMLEIAFGESSEEDIRRFDDNYGRT